MIYGEESEEFTFQNGLMYNRAWPVPDGFCQRFENLVVDQAGNAKLRGSFKEAITYQSGVNSNSFPNGLFGNTTSSTLAATGVPYATPVFNDNEATATSYGGVSPISLGADVRNGLGFIYNSVFYASKYGNYPDNISYTPGGYAGPTVQQHQNHVLYRDRLYWYENATGVMKVTGWNFSTAAAVAEVAVAGSPNTGASRAFFFFKDRLWLIIGTRVYFTDAIAVGGYPETWNIATNFFDLPTDADYTIQNYAILNNMIYLFTSSGVFVVQVQGLPTNWIVRKTSDSINVNDYNHVTTNNGVIYYANNEGVFAFNGYKSVNISQAISNLFIEYSGFGIHAFEDGILLSLQKFTVYQAIAGPPPRFKVRVTGTRLLYFDGQRWSEITFENGQLVSVISSFSNKYLAVTGGLARSYVEFAVFGATTLDRWHAYYKADDYSGDVINGVAKQVNPMIEIYKDYNKEIREKRTKYGYVEAYVENNLPIQFAPKQNAAAFDAPSSYATFPQSADGVVMVKVRIDMYGRRFKFRISTIVTAGVTTYVYNPIVFKKFYIVFNTARNNPDLTGA